VLPEEDVRALGRAGHGTVDLDRQVVAFDGREVAFEIDPAIRHRLLNGLDDIGVTLRQVDAIDRYERARERHGPVTTAL
jgi:3-isopropylmalate/(R)-2-methylmalate dehydratase small subunit